MLEQIEARVDTHLAALAKHEGNRHLLQLVSGVSSAPAFCPFNAGKNESLKKTSRVAEQATDAQQTCACLSAENPELVHQLEKSKEKQRRERARQEKLAQQHLKTDERLVASFQNSHDEQTAAIIAFWVTSGALHGIAHTLRRWHLIECA